MCDCTIQHVIDCACKPVSGKRLSDAMCTQLQRLVAAQCCIHTQRSDLMGPATHVGKHKRPGNRLRKTTREGSELTHELEAVLMVGRFVVAQPRAARAAMEPRYPTNWDRVTWVREERHGCWHSGMAKQRPGGWQPTRRPE